MLSNRIVWLSIPEWRIQKYKNPGSSRRGNKGTCRKLAGVRVRVTGGKFGLKQVKNVLSHLTLRHFVFVQAYGLRGNKGVYDQLKSSHQAACLGLCKSRRRVEPPLSTRPRDARWDATRRRSRGGNRGEEDYGYGERIQRKVKISPDTRSTQVHSRPPVNQFFIEFK